ncbi:hypothetical protein C0993_003754 [Termitomyces sp. T159_Od127]|nr:hypothetical protein C0993_003754 [Termitomyces sp. T159_Od127]
MPIAQRRRGSKIKGIQFTLMVVGTSGTGRTTFVNTLCEQEVLSHQAVGDPQLAHVEESVAIKPVHVELEEDGVRISLTVVDTPGFGHSIDSEHTFQEIVEYLERQYDDILAEQSRIKRNPRFKDNRVHAVLYFIPPTGHALKEMDIELMRRLSPRANVIPVIGRSDALTPRELKAFKKRIMEDIEYYNIPIYNFPYDEDEDDEETIRENMELRALLPLAVIGSEEDVVIDGESIRARVYPWGIVEIDNPDHSDFGRLRSAILGSHLNDLKSITEDVLYETYRTEKLSKTVLDNRQSQVYPEDLANQSVRLKEEQLRREEEKASCVLREVELRVQREISEKRQQLLAKEETLRTPAQWQITHSLLLATIIRTGLVVISYGCKVPAGIFVPSMAIGATFGRMIGILVKAMERAHSGHGIFAVCAPDVPCITPGTYAFLGAAAALSGVMRITVTVVVIMFELTGALNYILPTMIVLLVTKAVGDFLGTNGIADEMIRFNGFPFLEKEDHAYNVSVSAVMRTEIYTIVESGMNVKQIEDLLEATNVKGFPIESSDGLRHIIGYIGRTELRYVLGTLLIDVIRLATRLILFVPRDSEHSTHSVSFGIEEEAGTSFFESALSEGGLRFWPWVSSKTPITVSPELSLEIVMQLFKRMGPRVILVENHGVLTGLVTVKDVLKFIVTKPAHELSWDDRGGLDGLLEEIWTWATENIHRAVSWMRRR